MKTGEPLDCQFFRPPVRAVVHAALGALMVLTGCSNLRSHFSKTPSAALPPSSDARLGDRIAQLTAAHPGKSGLYVLDSNEEAFESRMLLLDAARRTIDLQYYAIHNDLTAKLLLDRLLAAADRGVRVRVLIDDNGLSGQDAALAALDTHPQIEVRIFNPFLGRVDMSGVSRLIEWFMDRRVNRRMHNKLFAVNNRVAILGGRNLGDEYFAAQREMNFHDLDLLAIGPAVPAASSSFDDYWNSPWAVPVTAFTTGRGTAADLASLRKKLEAHRIEAASAEYARRVRGSGLLDRLGRGTLPLVWAPAHVVCDRPQKVAADGPPAASLLGAQLDPAALGTRSELVLISPYFVPGSDGVEFFRQLRARGVRVRILTNSLASTDVPAVHSGYRRYREELVRMGVDLYEFKPTAKPLRRWRGSRTISLHAKAFVFDGQSVYVGSLNADPRSQRLNTELGLLVRSPELARQVEALFADASSPLNSYHVQCDDTGGLVWRAEKNHAPQTFHTEPKAGLWRRFMAGLCSLLPMEDQL